LPPPHAETDPKEIVEDCVYDLGCGYGNALLAQRKWHEDHAGIDCTGVLTGGRKADSNRRSLPVNELVSQAGMRMRAKRRKVRSSGGGSAPQDNEQE
jgi:hypothetical protein